MQTGEPRNDVERKLLTIWKHVLRLNEIGIADNFFDLGGHSLLAMRLLAEVDRVFGQRLPVATVFRAQTIEQMAAVLNQSSSMPWSSLVTLQPLGLRAAAVCDSRSIWRHDRVYRFGQVSGFRPARPCASVRRLRRVRGSPWSESRRSPNISSERSARSNPAGPTGWRASVSAESSPSRWRSS